MTPSVAAPGDTNPSDATGRHVDVGEAARAASRVTGAVGDRNGRRWSGGERDDVVGLVRFAPADVLPCPITTARHSVESSSSSSLTTR